MSETPKEERLEAALDLMDKDLIDKDPIEEENLEKPQKERPQQQKASNVPASVWAILGVFLSLVAIGIGSYGAFMAFELKQNSAIDSPQHPETVQALAKLQTAIQTIEKQNRNRLTRDILDQSIASQQSSLSETKAEIESVVAGLKQSIGTSSEDWLMAEAEYLIRLANQHVKMEQDAAGALTLLATADKIIQDAQGIVAFDLRKNLAEDMAVLRSVGQIDTDGIFVQLGALVNQVNKLEQKKLKFEVLAQKKPEPNGELDLLGQIGVFFRTAGSKLGSLVDYRRDGDLVTPILPPQEDYYLRQNLVMKIQHAQLALLRRNQQIFDSSLADSLLWIEQYFDPEHNVTLGMITTLKALQSAQVETVIPEITGSLREIRKLMTGFSAPAIDSKTTDSKVNNLGTVGSEQ